MLAEYVAPLWGWWISVGRGGTWQDFVLWRWGGWNAGTSELLLSGHGVANPSLSKPIISLLLYESAAFGAGILGIRWRGAEWLRAHVDTGDVVVKAKDCTNTMWHVSTHVTDLKHLCKTPNTSGWSTVADKQTHLIWYLGNVLWTNWLQIQIQTTRKCPKNMFSWNSHEVLVPPNLLVKCLVMSRLNY